MTQKNLKNFLKHMNGLSLPIRIRGETGSNTERKRKTEGIMMTKKLFTGIAVVALIGVFLGAHRSASASAGSYFGLCRGAVSRGSCLPGLFFYPPASSAWTSTPRWSLALTALTAWCPSPP